MTSTVMRKDLTEQFKTGLMVANFLFKLSNFL